MSDGEFDAFKSFESYLSYDESGSFKSFESYDKFYDKFYDKIVVKNKFVNGFGKIQSDENLNVDPKLLLRILLACDRKQELLMVEQEQFRAHVQINAEWNAIDSRKEALYKRNADLAKIESEMNERNVELLKQIKDMRKLEDMVDVDLLVAERKKSRQREEIHSRLMYRKDIFLSEFRKRDPEAFVVIDSNILMLENELVDHVLEAILDEVCRDEPGGDLVRKFKIYGEQYSEIKRVKDKRVSSELVGASKDSVSDQVKKAGLALARIRKIHADILEAKVDVSNDPRFEDFDDYIIKSIEEDSDIKFCLISMDNDFGIRLQNQGREGCLDINFGEITRAKKKEFPDMG